MRVLFGILKFDIQGDRSSLEWFDSARRRMYVVPFLKTLFLENHSRKTCDVKGLTVVTARRGSLFARFPFLAFVMMWFCVQLRCPD